MIVFLESGRLGNQLFQYAALRTLARPGERVVLVGFDQLRSVFEGLDASFPIRSGAVAYRACQALRGGVERIAAATRLLPLVRQDPQTGCPQRIGGLLPGPTLVLNAWFQSEAAFDPAVVAGLTLREALADDAGAFLDDLRQRGHRPVFVHVRRGDYLHFPSVEYPAVLPDDWYRERMAAMRAQLPGAYFVLFSEDVAHLRDAFGDGDDHVVHEAGPALAFAIMSGCDAGILSASSFAWWAAYFARRRGVGPFVAPEFWCGHRQREWYPPGIAAGFLTYA